MRSVSQSARTRLQSLESTDQDHSLAHSMPAIYVLIDPDSPSSWLQGRTHKGLAALQMTRGTVVLTTLPATDLTILCHLVSPGLDSQLELERYRLCTYKLR